MREDRGLRPLDQLDLYADEPSGPDESEGAGAFVGQPDHLVALVVLTHHHAAQDVPLKPSADLRLLTTHVLDDAPTRRLSGGVHIHLGSSPKPSAIVQAVQGLLWGSTSSV